MNYKTHKITTFSIGLIIAASLLFNLTKIFLQNPLSFISMFNISKEVGLPEIPYISVLVIFFSVPSAIGLMRNRRWGFLATYLSYLTGTLVVWFPFFPSFIFEFIPRKYRGAITLIAIYVLLGGLIYLHSLGKKQEYFRRPMEA